MSSKFVLTQDLLEPARVRLLEQDTQIILKMSLSKIISKSSMETEQKLPVKICLVDKKIENHIVGPNSYFIDATIRPKYLPLPPSSTMVYGCRCWI
ncbi:22822_t:CDS:2 [Rhizophagus irregularis]|nr:22822_t:CDS:2 [Rhizophagus irregularis]